MNFSVFESDEANEARPGLEKEGRKELIRSEFQARAHPSLNLRQRQGTWLRCEEEKNGVGV